MGLFDDFFGSEQDQKQKTAGTQVTDQQTKQAQISADVQKQTSEQTSEQTVQTDATTRLLSSEAEAALQNIFLQLTESFSAGGGSALPPGIGEGGESLLDLSNFLVERAKGTEGLIAGETGAILGEARRQGENALESNQTRLASSAGSNLNSIVQAAGAQGRADLESQLAALSGDLAIRGRQLGSQDLATAFGASAEGVRTSADVSLAGQGTGADTIAKLGQLLRGSTTEVTGAVGTTGKVSEDSEINRLIEALAEITQVSDTKTTGKGSTSVDSSPGVIPGIVDLFKGFD